MKFNRLQSLDGNDTSTRRPYNGELSVENDDFRLEAERLTVGNGEVAFHLKGGDSEGTYSVEGRSTMSSDGRYVSERLPVRYTRYAGEDQVVIVLTQVEETQQGCRASGEWRQDGECYKFHGLLRPFRAQT